MQTKIIEFKNVKDEFSRLNVAQVNEDIDFEIKRLLWLDGFEENGNRKSKASKLGKQIIIPIRGEFISVVRHSSNPDIEKVFYLNNPFEGLYFPPMAWRSIRGVSEDSVLLVICSGLHDEDDWIRDLDEWREACDQI